MERYRRAVFVMFMPIVLQSFFKHRLHFGFGLPDPTLTLGIKRMIAHFWYAIKSLVVDIFACEQRDDAARKASGLSKVLCSQNDDLGTFLIHTLRTLSFSRAPFLHDIAATLPLESSHD